MKDLLSTPVTITGTLVAAAETNANGDIGRGCHLPILCMLFDKSPTRRRDIFEAFPQMDYTTISHNIQHLVERGLAVYVTPGNIPLHGDNIRAALQREGIGNKREAYALISITPRGTSVYERFIRLAAKYSAIERTRTSPT